MNDDQAKRDLDLIQMVQRARMQHDAQAQPSQIAAVYWIEVKPAVNALKPTARAGYWQIVVSVSEIDTAWARVKTATEAGELGYKARVATAAHGGAKDNDQRMIRVMTYDADDAPDVARVGDALRALGFESIIYHRE